jgi:LytR cell envelope-related transcriptional attenuator
VVEFPVSAPAASEPFPWRAAALAASAIAAIELVLLVLVGGTLIAKPDSGQARTKATPKAGAAHAKPAAAPKAKPAPAAPTPAAELPRRKVKVMILNGNGRTGAAASASGKVRQRGYRVGVVGNAPRADYPRSIVMFRPGFAGEAIRLARDLGIGAGAVGPLDGMRLRQLAGAHAVVILGG